MVGLLEIWQAGLYISQFDNKYKLVRLRLLSGDVIRGQVYPHHALRHFAATQEGTWAPSVCSHCVGLRLVSIPIPSFTGYNHMIHIL